MSESPQPTISAAHDSLPEFSCNSRVITNILFDNRALLALEEARARLADPAAAVGRVERRRSPTGNGQPGWSPLAGGHGGERPAGETCPGRRRGPRENKWEV